MTDPRYHPVERGDRSNPKRTDRNFAVLTIFHSKLERLVAALPATEAGALLDYGCGNRPYEALLRTRFPRYVGADLEGNPLADLIVDPSGRIPSPESEFDCVLSTQVLEHVQDPAGYLREAFRVLRPGGLLILSTHGTWHYHPDPTDFWRWTIDGLQREIARAGFRIERVAGVLSEVSCAAQLWQDATMDRVPGVLRRGYVWLCQRFIGWIESRHPDAVSPNAAEFIVVARRPPDGVPA